MKLNMQLNEIIIDQDTLDYLEENNLEVFEGDIVTENPAIALWNDVTESRPYELSDFERKYFIPDL